MAIKTFYDAHERDLTPVDWRRITKALPQANSYSNDRAPRLDEIRKLVDYPSDKRIKPLILIMCSSGIRIGAWLYLQWKHVTPITDEKTGQIIAAKLLVYAGEPEQSYSYCTPEAYNALKNWMDYRALHGEVITPDSWLMRDIWRTMDVKRGREKNNCGRTGLATRPKKLEYEGLKRMVNRNLWDAGLRNVLPEGVRRHEWKQDHGYRKFFKTRAEQIMNHSNVELLIHRGEALQMSYYKPTEQEVLADYLKAADSLTIGHESALEKKVAELTQENQQKDYVIGAKLAEKERLLTEKEKMIASAREEILPSLEQKKADFNAMVDELRVEMKAFVREIFESYGSQLDNRLKLKQVIEQTVEGAANQR